MPLTDEEYERELQAQDVEERAKSHADSDPQAAEREYATAGTRRQEIADGYAEKAERARRRGEHEVACAYECEAGRSYLRAAEDFMKAARLAQAAGEPGAAWTLREAADANYMKAGLHYERCADCLLEEGEIDRARAALVRAHHAYVAVDVHATAKRWKAVRDGDRDAAARARKEADEAAKGAARVEGRRRKIRERLARRFFSVLPDLGRLIARALDVSAELEERPMRQEQREKGRNAD